MTMVGDLKKRYGFSGRVSFSRRVQMPGALLGLDAGRVLHVVAAAVQDDVRLDGGQDLHGLDVVGVGRAGGRARVGHGVDPLLQAGLVPRDQLLHVRGHGHLRGALRLQGRVGGGEVDDLRVVEDDADEGLSSALEGAELEGLLGRLREGGGGEAGRHDRGQDSASQGSPLWVGEVKSIRSVSWR
jgi:hypothetical protein